VQTIFDPSGILPLLMSRIAPASDVADAGAFALIREGKSALGKLAQAMFHGAVIIQIKGNFDAGMRLVKEVAEHAPVSIVNSINPFFLSE
jgi:threonine synthase